MPMHMPVDNVTQTITATCSGQATTLQDLMLAAVPEFIGGLAATLVIAAVHWAIRKKSRHRESVLTRGDQGS